MSVSAKRRVSGVGRLEYAVSAADVLKSDHPLNSAFVAWLGAVPPSRRKAREFLAKYPQYREVKAV
jgi:hypothetical protein